MRRYKLLYIKRENILKNLRCGSLESLLFKLLTSSSLLLAAIPLASHNVHICLFISVTKTLWFLFFNYRYIFVNNPILFRRSIQNKLCH